MADQKVLKKRLKALMALPENQVCSDCPEKKPTWASLIVPPPGAPPGTEKIGAFMCLECSGSHRRLGVHISFVRSVNLDSWKEFEVRAMENGGNAKVNAIFEANLNRAKPTNLADGPTRERYIRDKYERRKFYDPSGYALPGNSGGGNVAQAPASVGSSAPQPGTPSEIARQRVASRQARMKTSHSQMEAQQPVTAAPKVAQAPASAPVIFDLLDFGASEPAPGTTSAFDSDPFASPAPAPAVFSPPPAPIHEPKPAVVPNKLSPPPNSQSQQTSSQPGSEFLTPAPAPSKPPTKSNHDILALFNTPTPASTGFGNSQAAPSHNNMGMMGGMMPQQQASMGGMMGNQQLQQMSPQMMAMMNNNPQQQMMMMMMQQQQQGMQNMNNANMYNMNGMNMSNMNMGGMNNMNGTNMNNTNTNGMNTNGLNMNHMNGMYNMQAMGNSFAQQNMQNSNVGSSTPSYGNMSMNGMAHGMQQMNLGSQINQTNSNDDGGFGSPMGGNAPQRDDPFSSLGGMNAFR